MIFILLIATCYLCVSSENNDQSMHPYPKDDVSSRMRRENPKFLELSSEYWRAEAQKKLKMKLEAKLNTKIAKNVIMFLGDGMSTSTVSAARIYFGQKSGFTGEESVLSFEEFPHLGLSKVSSETFFTFFVTKEFLCLLKIRLIALISKRLTAPVRRLLIYVELKQITQRSVLMPRCYTKTARRAWTRRIMSAP